MPYMHVRLFIYICVYIYAYMQIYIWKDLELHVFSLWMLLCLPSNIQYFPSKLYDSDDYIDVRLKIRNFSIFIHLVINLFLFMYLQMNL